jgi:hypothetical protein
MFKLSISAMPPPLMPAVTERGNITTSKNHRMQVRSSYVSVNECWKSNSIADCIVNIKQSTDKVKIHGSE